MTAEDSHPFLRQEVAHLTEEYGGQWGISHVRRLLHLISEIAEDRASDEEVVWLAAHLHDWGAYSAWAQPGVDHAVRSTQVAAPFLRERGYPEERIQKILECIATHHSGDPDRSLEAVLLSDADGLDFLGIVGILRDFSKSPRDMRKAFATVRSRREKVPNLLCLEKTKLMAEKRLKEMDHILALFEQDSFGCF
jgi:uncharacterized protein